MADNKRVELKEEFLDEITGGSLRWYGSNVTIKGSNGPVYTRVKRYADCAAVMEEHCRGMSDQQTLDALLNAGYITQ